jgi:uncharacterized protein (DUF362 family)
MTESLNRRQFLAGAGTAASALLLGDAANALIPVAAPRRLKTPTSPVSIARATTYDLAALTQTFDRMLDQLGGIEREVRGKTVVVKVNLTGDTRTKFAGLSPGRTYQTHPDTALALATLLDRAGARRVRYVDCSYRLGEFESMLVDGGWDLKAFAALKTPVDFENTRNKGKGKDYTLVKVPWGGSLYPAYYLNHSYVDCDYYISLAKLKNHVTAGVTLSIKNNFGVTPTALYGQAEPNENGTNARVAMFHEGRIRPAAGLPQEIDPKASRATSYRVPRHTIDSLGIRPIDLAIIDGIESTSGGEGPWCGDLKAISPGVLLAGKNAVCTDAIATQVMGYNPLAASGTECFPGDNHLLMAAERGLGTCHPREIEVRGVPVEKARFAYNWQPKTRNY